VSAAFALSIGAAYLIGAVGAKAALRDPIGETIAVGLNIGVLVSAYTFWAWWLS
jgi:hypothetical protein